MKTYEVYVDTKFCQWELQKYIIHTAIEVPSYEDFLKIITGENSQGEIKDIKTIKIYDTVETEDMKEPANQDCPRFTEIQDG
jgi:hypothetical protein